MRKLLGIATLAGTLLIAGPAHAGGKERVVVDRFTDRYEFAIDCADFGAYEFENLVSGVQRVRVVEVSDKEGRLLQTVFHSTLRETNTNSVTGDSIALSGAVHEVWDYAADTRTLNGKVWMGQRPGDGVLFQDTGRITMTLGTRDATFIAGPHDVFENGLDPLVCAALAG
ncbi:MAG TPA: hypothetical protein VM266_13235 [Solirubrobacteraceae bacterium]|nr:hypothetical protein [Solirubrobacteraceae bacterium]